MQEGTAMETAHSISCRYCGDCFTRQDHLTRHELSHGEAKYRCPEAECGMAFHRQDVLKRHERVHQPEPTIKRRRPRRGIVPTSKPAKLQLVATSQLPKDTGDTSVAPAAANANAPLSLSKLAPSDHTLQPLDFCFVHYVQMCARRWPFMHSSVLQPNKMSREKHLAMAALGGCVVPEYREIAEIYYEEAKQSLVMQYGARVWPVMERQLQNHSGLQNEFVLELLQTHVLLLEYGLWHRDKEARKWAFDLAVDYASNVLPQLIKFTRQSPKLGVEGWKEWMYEEQLIRAIWTFSCVTQRAMENFPCAVSTLLSQKHIRLPRSDILFNAADEQEWDESRSELSHHGAHATDMTLEAVLQLISLHASSSTQALHSLTPMAQHVVLVALLEIYNNAIKHLTLAADGVSDSYAFIGTMQRVRSLWYKPPNELFFSNPPKALEFQNVLLMNHLCIKALIQIANEKTGEQHWSSLCQAASIANEILAPTLQKGAIHISSEASWLTDSASKRYIFEMAKAMMKWAKSLTGIGFETTSFEATGSKSLYNQVCKLLYQDEENRGHHDSGVTSSVNSSVEKVERFVGDIQKAWGNVLICPIVNWYCPQD